MHYLVCYAIQDRQAAEVGLFLRRAVHGVVACRGCGAQQVIQLSRLAGSSIVISCRILNSVLVEESCMI